MLLQQESRSIGVAVRTAAPFILKQRFLENKTCELHYQQEAHHYLELGETRAA